ncbi:MAG TPA: response regulator transcription factor [Anaerolineales bacterium]|nr:response regulator transcription factor [Anaerolineales bacterium]
MNTIETKPIKTLVVDDHILFREGLVSLLNDQPDFVAIGGADSVQEAIRLNREVAPELILLDIALPDGTGLEATRAILSSHPSAQIVFITIQETDDVLLAAAGSGAKGYFCRNISTNKMLELLRGLVRSEPAITLNLVGSRLNEFVHRR